MALSKGDRFGPYEILSPLGAGGMGEVYRARDLRLNRDVAIKVLPFGFANDPSRMARFEREAQLLAALNHPNIAAIYGIEQGALVMEFVDGADLKGPLPIDTALDYARQIAEALEAAHEKGIIHRDLKPANIKITPAGQVKLLDFGLAKATEETPGATTQNPTMSPTVSLAMTQAGVILGTAAYMSPEQARGKAVDKRADIWAFGVVLCEMLTARQMFGGETVSDTLAAVLRADPEWSALPPGTPAAIRRLLRRCLERDLKRRLPDIGTARLEIEDARMEPEQQPAVLPSKAARNLPWWVAVLGVAAIAGLGIAVVHFRETARRDDVARFEIPLAEKTRLAQGSRIAISPDGRRIAYNASGENGRRMIWVRALDSLETRMLPETEDGDGMFWSPDSRWIAFFTTGKLKKVEAGASSPAAPPQTICSIPGTFVSGAWGNDGVILFGSPTAGPLRRMSPPGCEISPVTRMDAQETGHAWPQFLPDGRHFIFFNLSSQPEDNAIYLGTLGSSEKKLLVRSATQGSYASSTNEGGHLFFMREGSLMAQPFDSKGLKLTGEASMVAERVWSYRTYGFFSASENGILAYGPGTRASNNTRLTWFDRNGNRLEDVGAPAFYGTISLSPDGKRVAASQDDPQGPQRNLWILDLVRNTTGKFTLGTRRDAYAVWSPDGSRVAFASSQNGPYDIYLKEIFGTREAEPLLKSELIKLPLDWSADGKLLLYGVGIGSGTSRSDVWVLPLEGDRKARPLLNGPFDEIEAQFSPGPGAPRWVAYSSNESGQFQVYVRSVDGGPSGRQFQVSTAEGGRQPRWHPNGKELFYISRGNLMSVEVRTAPAMEFGNPKLLFAAGSDLAGVGSLMRYAVSPDGKRFLMVSGRSETSTPLIRVVLNWTAGLRK